MISQSPKGLLKRKTTTIKSSFKQSEPTFTRETKQENNESGTILKSSDKSSVNEVENKEYKSKPQSHRRSSAGKSSQSGLTGRVGSRTSQSSNNKKSKK